MTDEDRDHAARRRGHEPGTATRERHRPPTAGATASGEPGAKRRISRRACAARCWSRSWSSASSVRSCGRVGPGSTAAQVAVPDVAEPDPDDGRDASCRTPVSGCRPQQKNDPVVARATSSTPGPSRVAGRRGHRPSTSRCRAGRSRCRSPARRTDRAARPRRSSPPWAASRLGRAGAPSDADDADHRGRTEPGRGREHRASTPRSPSRWDADRNRSAVPDVVGQAIEVAHAATSKVPVSRSSSRASTPSEPTGHGRRRRPRRRRTAAKGRPDHAPGVQRQPRRDAGADASSVSRGAGARCAAPGGPASASRSSSRPEKPRWTRSGGQRHHARHRPPGSEIAKTAVDHDRCRTRSASADRAGLTTKGPSHDVAGAFGVRACGSGSAAASRREPPRPRARDEVSSAPRRRRPSQLASIRCPPWVSTDSGWNCTPWIGSSRCRIAMTMPLSVCAGDLEFGRDGLVEDGQRVVAGGGERVGQTGENARAVV